ncbi:SCO family protein [Mesorhizobium sp. CO1-1-8]|uniref:SCO family protein n=1 Tax=Mesorhizobium sp. CO1-1-8 TaxID=2876631 RepID=UPI001CD17847|nr:SCO family protein [Mesorhizobium sp. CO1-1-8]MBZ9772521.1 SCO family protein [Mesorhizobium sp. CO1-1-8]
MPKHIHKFAASSVATLLILVAVVSGCRQADPWHLVDMEGRLPPLAFNMTSATDGKPVTADAFRGKVVVLEFGYTSCPEICPTTLFNLSKVLHDLGDRAQNVVVLFVTVDPDRDTAEVLKQYAGYFSPQVIGLRGTPNQLASLARRYRVAYSVKPLNNGQDFEVMHTTTLFIFDQSGDIRLLAPNNDDTAAMEHDLRVLAAPAS